MVPINTQTMSPSDSDVSVVDNGLEEPITKRICIDISSPEASIPDIEMSSQNAEGSRGAEKVVSKYQAAEDETSESEQSMAVVLDKLLFNDDPRQLLRRSVTLALEHVGFTGASAEALEALYSEVDMCEYSLLSSHEPILNSIRCPRLPFARRLVDAQLPKMPTHASRFRTRPHQIRSPHTIHRASLKTPHSDLQNTSTTSNPRARGSTQLCPS